jgi:hypothetical protein
MSNASDGFKNAREENVERKNKSVSISSSKLFWPDNAPELGARLIELGLTDQLRIRNAIVERHFGRYLAKVPSDTLAYISTQVSNVLAYKSIIYPHEFPKIVFRPVPAYLAAIAGIDPFIAYRRILKRILSNPQPRDVIVKDVFGNKRNYSFGLLADPKTSLSLSLPKGSRTVDKNKNALDEMDPDAASQSNDDNSSLELDDDFLESRPIISKQERLIATKFSTLVRYTAEKIIGKIGEIGEINQFEKLMSVDLFQQWIECCFKQIVTDPLELIEKARVYTQLYFSDACPFKGGNLTQDAATLINLMKISSATLVKYIPELKDELIYTDRVRAKGSALGSAMEKYGI